MYKKLRTKKEMEKKKGHREKKKNPVSAPVK